MSIGHPPEKKQRCLELLAQNYTPDQIHLMEGVGKRTVQEWRKESQIKQQIAAESNKADLPRSPPDVLHVTQCSTSPRIMTADVECLPNRGFFFRTWTKQNIPIHTDFIEEHYAICSIAWKWMEEDITHVVTNADFPAFETSPFDDKGVLSAFLPEIKKADYVIIHNGKRFDKKIIKTRLKLNGMEALPPVTIVDTLTLARSNFDFNSNKLDYIAQLLEIGQKKETNAKLWTRCANGDREAMNYMGEYNAVDVEILEKCYLGLRKHLEGDPINYNLFSDSPIQLCEACGSDNLKPAGRVYTKATFKHLFECNDCGKYSTFPAKKK